MTTRGKRPITFETVRALAEPLADVTIGTTYGEPSLAVGGKMFACVPTHKSAEPGSLALRIPYPRRAELLAADPDAYYVPHHYQLHPIVLVRLEQLRKEELAQLLAEAHAFMSKKASRTRRPRRAR